MATFTTRIQFLGLEDAEQSVKSLAKGLRLLRAEQAQLAATDPRYKELAQEIGKAEAQLKDLKLVQRDVTKAFEAQGKVAGSFAALKAETKVLTTEFENLAVGVNTTQEAYDALAKKIQTNNLKITDLNRELRGSKSIAERFREGAVAAFKDVALQITGAVGAVQGFNAIKNLGQEFLSIEKGFAKVNTVAQLSTEELSNLKGEVLDLARQSNVELETIPDALFTIQSATGDVGESQSILAASLRAAKAGFGELQTTAQAGVGIFGAVKNQVSGIDEVFDTLFRTQKEGLLTFGDLSQEFPKVVPSIQALGAGFQESAAALATFTKFGFNANQGATALDATLKGLAKTQVQKNLKEIGVSVFDAAGKTRPLVAIVGDLTKSLDGLTDKERLEKLGSIGLDENAAKGLNSLSSNLKVFGEVSDSIVNGSAGELDRQFAASANTADDLQIAINNLKVDLIQELGPAFETVTRIGISLVGGLGDLIRFMFRNKDIILVLAGAYATLNASKIQSAFLDSLNTKGTVLNTVATAANTVAQNVAATSLKVATAAKAAYGFATDVLTGKIALATAAQRVLNLVMSANPFGLVIAGATALAATFIILANRTKELTHEQQLQVELGNAVSEAYGKETAQSAALFSVLKSETATREQRNKAMELLNKQYGQYLPSLLTEASSLKDVEAAQNAVNAALMEKVRLQIQEQKITEISGKQQQALFEGTTELQKATKLTQAQIQDALNAVSNTFKRVNADQIVQIGLATDSFEGTLDAVTKLSGVGPEVQASLDKIKASGVAFEFLGLAGVVSATNKEMETVNNFFSDQAPIQVMSDSLSDVTQSFGDAADNVKILNEQIAALKEKQQLSTTAKEWSAIEKEINKVERAIAKITGESKGDKKITDEAKKAEQQRLKDIEDSYVKLSELRKQLADSEVDQIANDTIRAIHEEELRYAGRLQAILDGSAAILAQENSTEEQRLQAQQITDKLIENEAAKHEELLLDIQRKAGEKETAERKAQEEERRGVQADILNTELATIDAQIELAGKNLEKKRELFDQEKKLRLDLLSIEEQVALSSLTNEEESQGKREVLMRSFAAKRLQVVKESDDELLALQKEKGSVLSQVLGISDEEIGQFKAVFEDIAAFALENIEQGFEARKKLIDEALKQTDERIANTSKLIEEQAAKIEDLEAQLATATGDRRQRLIQQIERAREAEKALAATQAAGEKRKQDLLEETAAIEAKQAKIRKAQAMAQVVVNTAVGISRAIADVPKVDFGVSTGILIALYAALGAAQLAAIAAQKFAKGGLLNEGGILQGPSHAQGGIPIAIPSQGRMVEAEGREAIINALATDRNADALMAINADRGKTKFDLMPRRGFFADGGMVSPVNTQAILNSLESNKAVALLAQLVESNSVIAAKNFSPVLDTKQLTDTQRLQGEIAKVTQAG